MSTRPRYHFYWWCSQQLWGKRAHATIRSTPSANDDASVVIAHRACADEMGREGEWELVVDAA